LAQKEYEQLQAEAIKTREKYDPEFATKRAEEQIEADKVKAEQEKKALEAEMLRQSKANSKQVTNNFNNKINIPLTVDDKGETRMSAMALDSAVKTAIRSAFAIEFIQTSEAM